VEKEGQRNLPLSEGGRGERKYGKIFDSMKLSGISRARGKVCVFRKKRTKFLRKIQPPRVEGGGLKSTVTVVEPGRKARPKKRGGRELNL